MTSTQGRDIACSDVPERACWTVASPRGVGSALAMVTAQSPLRTPVCHIPSHLVGQVGTMRTLLPLRLHLPITCIRGYQGRMMWR